MLDWKSVFETGLGYESFLARFGTSDQAGQWKAGLEKVVLTDAVTRVLDGFTRRMNVVCLAGAWCGDCARQCPILQRFAETTSRIDLRFLDREANAEAADELKVCGGGRVPVVVFLSEDFAECGRYGDRTLSVYRNLAASQLGTPPPTMLDDASGADPDAIVNDWLYEFERIHLMLRLSPRLRRLHND